MNINLASKITDYKIDAYGVKQYERIQTDHKTPLANIEGISSAIASSLGKVGINIVSELLDADMDNLLSAKDVDEDSLDSIYGAVQDFVERVLEIEPEEEVDMGDLLLDEDSPSNDSNEPETNEPELDDEETSSENKPIAESAE
jgi:hypothetical protein